MRRLAGSLVLLLLLTAGCGGAPLVVAGYDLDRPVQSFALPPVLREISAMAPVGGESVACLQDEQGALFCFDLARGRLDYRAHFGKKGDYEGLARVGDTFFVLRSDGLLLRLRPDGSDFAVEASAALGLEQREFEGLGYDAVRGRLIVAPKDVLAGKENKELRPLYGVDPATLAVDREPLVVVHLDEVLEAAQRLGIAVPTRTTEKGHRRPYLQLHLAEVAVHPETGDYWLLSAGDRALLVVDRSGRTRGLRFFTADELAQPEGAAFLPGGDLVLASEGVGSQPAVLRVYRRPK